MTLSSLRARSCLTVLVGLLGIGRVSLGAESLDGQEFLPSDLPDQAQIPADEAQAQVPSPEVPPLQAPPPQGQPAPAPPHPDQASQEPSKIPWRTFEFQFGATYSSISSSVALNRKGGVATLAIEPEQALGMEDELVSPSVWTAVRIGDRHRIQFSLDDYTRTSTASLVKDLQFNGDTYTVGTNVHTTFGIQFFDLSYAFSFFQDERMDLAVCLGVDWIRTHFDVESSALRLVDNERINIPYPLPGFDFDFAISRDWWIRERLNAMYLSLSGYTGLVVDFDLSLEWSFIDHLAVGLGGNIKRVEFTQQSNSTAWGNFGGEAKMSAVGLILYLNVYF